ncbi:YafY family protein [Psychrobacillus sp. FSL H8-0484]|uniref:helix-turn-helix transcriptional regulator n=1 Tax=Psychrobacillus sp. FSL H8-0484 TaxID=2921390 RepID=UPI0030FADB2F
MKIERLLSILVVLLNNEIVSADELAKKFEVSKRTIYRDIESLALANLPVVTFHGRNGGVGLMASYKMDRYLFSDEEKQKIIEALKIQTSMVHEDSQMLIDKLESLRGINNMSEHFSFYSPTIHRKEIEQNLQDKLILLKQAIALNRKLHIEYVSQSGEITHRVISPYKIVLNGGSWYLEAYCEKRNDRRLFKLTRIRNYTLLDEEFAVANVEEIDLAPSCEIAELVFQRDQLGKLYDFFLEDEITIHENYIKVIFSFDNNRNLLPFLFMFSSSVEIIKPESLKRNYYNELNKIYNKLNSDTQLSYIP